MPPSHSQFSSLIDIGFLPMVYLPNNYICQIWPLLKLGTHPTKFTWFSKGQSNFTLSVALSVQQNLNGRTTSVEWDYWKTCIQSATAPNRRRCHQCILTAEGSQLLGYNRTARRIPAYTLLVWMQNVFFFVQPKG